MSRATPQMRDLAKRLMSHANLRKKSPTANTRDNFFVVDRLRPHLATLVGNDGFRALLSRALALASAEVPWLRALSVKADGTLEGSEASHTVSHEQIVEGNVVLLAQLLGLLVAFIGANLTIRLVGAISPKLSLDGVDLAHEKKNEKSK